MPEPLTLRGTDAKEFPILCPRPFPGFLLAMSVSGRQPTSRLPANGRHSRQLTNRGLAFPNSHHQERVPDGAPPLQASTTIS
jgi:hypothetical protein